MEKGKCLTLKKKKNKKSGEIVNCIDSYAIQRLKMMKYDMKGLGRSPEGEQTRQLKFLKSYVRKF